MDTDFVHPSADPAYAALSASYTGTAGSTSTFPPGARGVLIWTTTDAYVRIGEGVTATTSDCPVPAYTPIIFRVPTGTVAPWRVSAIQVASGGTVYAKPVG